MSNQNCSSKEDAEFVGADHDGRKKKSEQLKAEKFRLKGSTREKRVVIDGDSSAIRATGCLPLSDTGTTSSI